jgi:hypothetical protein
MKLVIFNKEYDNYVNSTHCRASKTITSTIKNHFINELTYNSVKYENRNFEEIFKIVYGKLSQHVSNGGGDVTRNCSVDHVGWVKWLVTIYPLQ